MKERLTVSLPKPPTQSEASLAAVANSPLIDGLYQQWKDDPSSVARDWQLFFEGFDLAACPRSCVAADQARDQSKVASLIYAYRSRGHAMARVDPLGDAPSPIPDLELEAFGLTSKDLDRIFDTGHLGGPERAPLQDILGILQDTYCRSIGVEYLHIQDVKQRRWLQARMEPERNRPGM
ncbi:MAG: hypothetical protein B7X11_02240, partial [Acidobacteria bacterium 37-65-4]